MSKNLSHGFFSLLDRIVIVLFGFLNIFFLARMMSKAEVGAWVLFTSVTAILEMIRVGFIRNPFVTNYVSAESDERKHILTSSVILHVLLSLVIAALLVGMGKPLADLWNAGELVNLFLIYAVNTIVFVPQHHFEYMQQVQLKFKGIFVGNIVRLGIPSVYIMFGYFTHQTPSLSSIAMVQVGATIVTTFVGYYYVRGAFDFAKRWDRASMKELFHYGKFTLGTNISSMFVKNTDSWMIGKLVSTAGVALYNPAIRISNLVEVPTVAIASVFFPQVAQRLKERGKEGVRDVYVKSVSLILALTLPIVTPLYIFAELAIAIIFGKEYVESATILRVTLFYTLIIPFNRQFGTVMDGTKQPKINFYLLLLVAVLNIILNYIFLTQFGVIGSAWATLLSFLTVFILNQIILYKKFDINTFDVFPEIINWYKTGWNMFSTRVLKRT